MIIRRGFTLISTLVTIAIMMALAVVMLRGSMIGQKTTAGQPATIPGMAMQRAREVECQSDLNQVRQAIMLRTTTDDEKPASLKDLKLGEHFEKCPVGGEPYVYDPTTGTVKCPHPGHGKF